MMKKRRGLVVIASLAALLCGTNGLAWADEGKAEMKMRLGDSNASLNGAPTTIEKPYASNGVTMVPLSVITKTLGATFTWNSETNSVEISNKDHTIQFTIGSKKAVVNGKTVELEAAPEMKNNTTMVPLRFVSEALGGSVQYNPGSAEISLIGTSSNAASTSSEADSFNNDVGKTKIGDAYLGWSMKYPTGLIKDYQSFKGDYVSFSDANNEYTIGVYTDVDQPENLSHDGLISKAMDEVEGTIISKGFVEEGGRSYAKVVEKSDYAGTIEYRVMQSGDKIFYLTLTVNKEENYKNPVKYKAYKDLLDSFTASFDQNDKTVKDISGIKDGYRTYTDETYGVTVRVPADWYKGSEDDYIVFYNEDESQSLKFRVTSLTEKDTLDAWVARNEQLYRDMIAPGYLEVDKEVKSTTIAGTPAKVQKFSKKQENKWHTEHEFFLLKNNYKFYFEIKYDRDADKDKIDTLVNTITGSIAINPNKLASLGFIQDSDMADKSKLVTVKNKKYNYQIDLPELWKPVRGYGQATDSGFMNYQFSGGGVVGATMKTYGSSLDKDNQDFLTGMKQALPDSKMEATTSEKYAGVDAKKTVYEVTLNGSIMRGSVFVFKKGDYTYMLNFVLWDFAKTKLNEDNMQKVIASFRFLN